MGGGVLASWRMGPTLNVNDIFFTGLVNGYRDDVIP